MKEPRYQITYKELKRTNLFLKGIIVALLGVCVYAITLVSHDPLVIRQTEHDIQVIDVESSALNEYDIEIFIKHFVHNLNLYDSFKIKDAYLSLNMMTDSLQRQFVSDVFTQELLDSVKRSKTTTTTTWQEIGFEQQGEKIKVEAVYIRKRRSFEREALTDKAIRIDMILDILPTRTKEAPYGLLVSQYKRTPLS